MTLEKIEELRKEINLLEKKELDKKINCLDCNDKEYELFLNKYVIVRTYSAGVFAGYFGGRLKDGKI